MPPGTLAGLQLLPFCAEFVQTKFVGPRVAQAVLNRPVEMTGKTLVFQPKTDWPKFTDVDWNSDKGHVFLKF